MKTSTLKQQAKSVYRPATAFDLSGKYSLWDIKALRLELQQLRKLITEDRISSMIERILVDST